MLIRVVDLETVGFEPPADGVGSGVCEIGWADLRTETTDLAGRPYGWRVGLPSSVLINPGRPIPPETSAVHHLVDEDVCSGFAWEEAAPEILNPTPLVPSDEAPLAIAAHSAKFERQFCTDEMTRGLPWICTYKCALRLWPDAPLHSNQGLRYWRRPEGLIRQAASLAHRAGPDAYVTAFHLRDLLELAPLEDLILWSGQPALQVRCHIGKVWRGEKWTDVDTGFLWWVAERDFDEDVLFTVRHELERRERQARESEAA